MAKIIDYPRASFKSCLEVAAAIDSLGGKSSIEMAAEKTGRKLGGAWQALVASTIRFGLITNTKGQLITSQLYRDYKLAYNDAESKAALTKAFLMPPIFNQITGRFNGMELPVSHFEKLLIKELSVPEDMASRVAKYYIEGAKLTGILSADGIVNSNTQKTFDSEAIDDEEIEENNEPDDSIDSLQNQKVQAANKVNEKPEVQIDNSLFSVRISGPGMDSLITVNDTEDLSIIHAMIKKIEKQLQNNDLNI